MYTTSLGLLDQLHQSERSPAWSRFVDLYTPLLHYWACQLPGMQDADASDLVQDVFLALIQLLPEFQYEPEQSFRAWIRTILINRWRDRRHIRATAPMISNVELMNLPGVDPLDEVHEDEYRQYLVGRAFQLMQGSFESSIVWQACWEVVFCGRDPAAVAAELGMSLASVYVAKSRVLRRLREELGGLLD